MILKIYLNYCHGRNVWNWIKRKSAWKHNRSRQTSRDQHNNALMMGKGASDERFWVPTKEVVERSFRSVLLATNMSSYVPKCAKEISDPYFRCYQQNSFTLPLFCWLLSLTGHIPSLNINSLTHACIFQALSCWFRLAVKRTNFCCALKHFFASIQFRAFIPLHQWRNF